MMLTHTCGRGGGGAGHAPSDFLRSVRSGPGSGELGVFQSMFLSTLK